MSTKHTPGPWHISIPKFVGKWAGFNTMQGKCIGVYATNDDLEAIALVPKDELLIHKEQDHESNAKLIAAAPELLEALQCLFNACEVLQVLPKNAPEIKLAKSAIKKATE